jgi:hypothetical protein
MMMGSDGRRERRLILVSLGRHFRNYFNIVSFLVSVNEPAIIL